MDTPAAPRDLHVVQSRGPHFVLVRAWRAEDRVRVRVDERGRDDPARAVDPFSVPESLLQVATWANGGDAFSAHRHGAVLDDLEDAHLGAPARRRWPRARDNLPCIDEDQLALGARGARGAFRR